MRRFYSALAWIIAGGVVVQAAAIAFGFGGMVGYVRDGGVVDQTLMESRQSTFTGDLGFPIHAIVGGLLIPVVALVLGVSSFFVRGVPRAKRMAWTVFGLVFVQVMIAYSIGDVPYLGAIHGANALAILLTSVYTARLPARAREQVDADASDPSVLV